MKAASPGRCDIAKVLLKYGANKDHQDVVGGYSRTGGHEVDCKFRAWDASATPRFVFISILAHLV